MRNVLRRIGVEADPLHDDRTHRTPCARAGRPAAPDSLISIPTPDRSDHAPERLPPARHRRHPRRP
ncbi:hypothetical protein MICRO8M_80561 [Microbacterium sp. 8M]|nr:hypothetical protein MICRO8M_80561 [Microbacterium sp. 8M]